MIFEKRNTIRQVSTKINSDFALNYWGDIKVRERINFAQLSLLLAEVIVFVFVIFGWVYGG